MSFQGKDMLSKGTVSQDGFLQPVFRHQKAGRHLDVKVKAHSTRRMSTSAALNGGLPLPDIFRAAISKNRHTFTRHYCLDKSEQRHGCGSRSPSQSFSIRWAVFYARFHFMYFPHPQSLYFIVLNNCLLPRFKHVNLWKIQYWRKKQVTYL